MRRKIGAEWLPNERTKFTVWAPFKHKVEVVFKDRPAKNLLESTMGYWEGEISDIKPGTLYKYRLDDEEEFPDPASRSQPHGVHSWSRVTDPEAFLWDENNWKGIPLEDMIIYELHVGAFTPEGTFEAVINKLNHLKDLGINTIEILPISQFPGNRNWGYDGVYPFAAQHSYGGQEGLKKMINACHQNGIAVLLDAVYNHMGPEGNYLSKFGPYFTEKYHTPWGSAINFDDKYSDEVRNFFLENVRMWLEEFRFDGLRLDAIHEIIDRGAKHFLKEMSEEIDLLEKKTDRHYTLIAESDLNDTKIINPYATGGFGLEGQWVDDFHHSLHSLLTGENEGYYKDYGNIGDMAKSFKQAFIYDGVYSQFRKRKVGNSPAHLPSSKFVVCIQNHDQVGNRILGERLSQLVTFEKSKLAAGLVLISPFVPMLFMGEEFGENSPFMYFISHGDPVLIKAVQEGRKREFEYFYNRGGDFPNPQSEKTFERSKLNWNFKNDPEKEIILEYYKELIKLRKEKAFTAFYKKDIETEVFEEEKCFVVKNGGEANIFGIFNFNEDPVDISLPESNGPWKKVFSSGDEKWMGKTNLPQDLKPGEQFKMPATSILILKH